VSSALVDDSMAERKEQAWSWVWSPRLVEEARDMVALGADADAAPVGDRLAVEARGEGFEHFAFAPGEAGDGLPVLPRLLAPAAGEAEQLGDLLDR
jgi:hypothetical protein